MNQPERLSARKLMGPEPKGWGIKLAKRIGMKKAKVAIARKIAVILPGRTGR
jgi:hypothetical protein